MEKLTSNSIVWTAGENSGDYLASRVLPSLSEAFPQMTMEGIGGERMVADGLQSWYSASELSVRGYLEVVRHLPRILKIRRDVIRRTLENRPAAYIGVDAPDFNLAIEEKVRSTGIPVVHMVAPAVWAWRPQRIHQIKRAVDHLLLIFPFEEKIFREAGISCTYIGHPLADLIPLEPDTLGAREKIGLKTVGPVIAILPGSRKDEIKWCAPEFFGAADLVLKSEPTSCFVIPAADTKRKEEILKVLAKFPAVKEASLILDGQSHTAMEASDAILVASGTATLEAALYKKPLVIGYKMPALSAMLILSKGQTKWIGLPNILAQKSLVPECVQMFCSPEILSSHLLHALEPKRQEALKAVFTDIHHSLLRPTVQLTTEAIEKVLKR